jgi:hypothetical protein
MLSAFTLGTVLLPNDDVLPTTDASTECFEENLLPNGALLPNSTHMSVSFLYQFLVLTVVSLTCGIHLSAYSSPGCAARTGGVSPERGVELHWIHGRVASRRIALEPWSCRVMLEPWPCRIASHCTGAMVVPRHARAMAVPCYTSYQSHGRAGPCELPEPWSRSLRVGLPLVLAAGPPPRARSSGGAAPVCAHADRRGSRGRSCRGCGAPVRARASRRGSPVCDRVERLAVRYLAGERTWLVVPQWQPPKTGEMRGGTCVGSPPPGKDGEGWDRLSYAGEGWGGAGRAWQGSGGGA